MKYKLFITDYDGTLGRVSVIEPDTLAAVKKFIALGGKFVVCTGRLLFSIRDILLKYGLNCPVISYQGALIDELASGKRIFSGWIDYNFAAEVVSTVKSENADVAVDVGETRIYEKASEFTKTYETVTGIHGKLVDNLESEILSRRVPVLKITLLTTPETARMLTEKYSKLYEGRLLVNNGAETIVEFVNPDCNKGRAVERIAKYLGVPLSEVIAVGDSTNDITLIDGAWHGVAVGDAREELKRVADEITVPYDAQPVKYLLEKYCFS